MFTFARLVRIIPRAASHFSRCLSPSTGQRRLFCSFNASTNWLGHHRSIYHPVLSHEFSTPRIASCRKLASSCYASRDTKASNDETASDVTVTSSGQADGQGFGFKYCPIDDVERLEKYQTGGYHPIAIGDTLVDGRYEIVDKLGHGGYSTIWIARDKSAVSTYTYVAVKICICDNIAKSQEKKTTRKLLDSDDDRASMILPIIDEFVVEGPNGQHPCIVTPPARMSIAASKSATYGYNIFPLPTARSIAAQLAQVVAFCHAQGVAHGDLHAGNVLLCFSLADNIHSLSQSEFYERFGAPYQEPVDRIDGGVLPPSQDPRVPTHGVAPASLSCRPQEVTLAESSILLADFGESYVPSASGLQRTYCHAPLRVRPPEARFATDEIGFPADIWALACVIWEVVCGSGSLFGPGFFPSDDGLCKDWVHALGRLPDEWWTSWDEGLRRDLFTEDGVVRDDRRGHFISCDPGLEARFELLVQGPRREDGVQEFLDAEKAALLEMLRAMLAYKPADRIGAPGVLNTEWMRRWGLPALDDSKELRH